MVQRLDYAYVLEGQFVGGFSMVVPHTYWCWIKLLSTENIYASYRVIYEWINEFCDTYDVKRLQAFVRDIPENKRLVEHLGFQQESVMTNFFGDEDALMYVRLI